MTPTTISKTITGTLAVLVKSAFVDQQPNASPNWRLTRKHNVRHKRGNGTTESYIQLTLTDAPAVVSKEKVAVTCFHAILKPDTLLRTVVKTAAKKESIGSSVIALATMYSLMQDDCEFTISKLQFAVILLENTHQCRILSSTLFSFHYWSLFSNERYRLKNITVREINKEDCMATKKRLPTFMNAMNAMLKIGTRKDIRASKRTTRAQ